MSKFFKSFVRGMGQAIDLGGTLAPQRGKTGPEADAAALRGDWNQVGRDMHKAVRAVKNQPDDSNQESSNRDLVHVG